jgi:hypothetical protein
MRLWRRTAALVILALLLVMLQYGLLLSRGTATVVSSGKSSSAAPASAVVDGLPLLMQQLLGSASDGESRTFSAESVAAAAAAAAATRNSSAKQCGTASDQQATDFPRNRILIIHEQHLQSMGCDIRLLRFVKDLLYLNQEVSLMFRASTPSKMRQPKSKQLASILHIDSFEEEQLRRGLRRPPGIYEWTSADRFSQLMKMGYFNVVIVFLWFWYDPQPSVAELVLPLVRAHAPADRQPFVALLSDDAHSIRSSRLGEVEIHLATRNGYNGRARNYWFRQKHMYRLADMVMHISAMDQVAEKESYPFIKHYNLLRMPIRAFRILNKNTPVAVTSRLDRPFLRTANIGFIGNGMTPTNHLGIQWFLEHCWEDLQRQLPGVRLRLIGRPPGERTLKGQQVACVKNEDPHCGWAWGTPYSGAEAENGIDELGYLSADEMLDEVLSWRLFIVPVLRTTGINTKILVALELGVPLVITPVAASPFDFPENETIVAFADQALDFVQETVSVYTVSWLWTKLSRASRAHWENLATHDPARNDVRVVLADICQHTSEQHYNFGWAAPQIRGEPERPKLLLPRSACGEGKSSTSTCEPPRALSSCFAGGNWSSLTAAPLLRVGSHSMHDVFPAFDALVRHIWESICRDCSLRCSVRQPGEPYALAGTDVVIDQHWSLPLAELDATPHRLIFHHWDPGKMGKYFHLNGNLLETIRVTEDFVAQAMRRPETALTFQVNKEMRSSGGFVYSWRKALTHLGFIRPATTRIIQKIVNKVEGNWTSALLAHMAAYKAG